MTAELSAVFDQATLLPEKEQDALAAILRQEIEAERRWDELFARPESQCLLEQLADQALDQPGTGGN